MLLQWQHIIFFFAIVANVFLKERVGSWPSRSVTFLAEIAWEPSSMNSGCGSKMSLRSVAAIIIFVDVRVGLLRRE